MSISRIMCSCCTASEIRRFSDMHSRISLQPTPARCIWGFDPSTVHQTLHILPSGLEVKLDDNVVGEMREGQGKHCEIQGFRLGWCDFPSANQLVDSMGLPPLLMPWPRKLLYVRNYTNPSQVSGCCCLIMPDSWGLGGWIYHVIYCGGFRGTENLCLLSTE